MGSQRVHFWHRFTDEDLVWVKVTLHKFLGYCAEKWIWATVFIVVYSTAVFPQGFLCILAAFNLVSYLLKQYESCCRDASHSMIRPPLHLIEGIVCLLGWAVIDLGQNPQFLVGHETLLRFGGDGLSLFFLYWLPLQLRDGCMHTASPIRAMDSCRVSICLLVPLLFVAYALCCLSTLFIYGFLWTHSLFSWLCMHSKFFFVHFPWLVLLRKWSVLTSNHLQRSFVYPVWPDVVSPPLPNAVKQ